jgi:threonine dehydrogenase-like Zn-dependent dehydrogenase
MAGKEKIGGDSFKTSPGGSPGATVLQTITGLMPDPIAAKMTEKAAVDRLSALLDAIDSIRRGGTVSISGVYGGQLDPLPMTGRSRSC